MSRLFIARRPGSHHLSQLPSYRTAPGKQASPHRAVSMQCAAGLY